MNGKITLKTTMMTSIVAKYRGFTMPFVIQFPPIFPNNIDLIFRVHGTNVILY